MPVTTMCLLLRSWMAMRWACWLAACAAQEAIRRWLPEG